MKLPWPGGHASKLSPRNNSGTRRTISRTLERFYVSTGLVPLDQAIYTVAPQFCNVEQMTTRTEHDFSAIDAVIHENEADRTLR